jgi:hypothetical protein
VQFGLIAEEVAEVLPEVVYRNAEGRVEGVRYDELTPMLVDLAQKQQGAIRALQAKLAAQAAQLTEMSKLERQMTELKGLVASLTLNAKDERVAMR